MRRTLGKLAWSGGESIRATAEHRGLGRGAEAQRCPLGYHPGCTRYTSIAELLFFSAGKELALRFAEPGNEVLLETT